MSTAILSTSIIPVRDSHRQTSLVYVRIVPRVRTLDAPTIGSDGLREAIREAGREYGLDVVDGLQELPGGSSDLVKTYTVPLLTSNGTAYDLRLSVA